MAKKVAPKALKAAENLKRLKKELAALKAKQVTLSDELQGLKPLIESKLDEIENYVKKCKHKNLIRVNLEDERYMCSECETEFDIDLGDNH